MLAEICKVLFLAMWLSWNTSLKPHILFLPALITDWVLRKPMLRWSLECKIYLFILKNQHLWREGQGNRFGQKKLNCNAVLPHIALVNQEAVQGSLKWLLPVRIALLANMVDVYTPALLSHLIRAASGIVWPLLNQLPEAEADLEGADSWRMSADYTPHHWAPFFKDDLRGTSPKYISYIVCYILCFLGDTWYRRLQLFSLSLPLLSFLIFFFEVLFHFSVLNSLWRWFIIYVWLLSWVPLPHFSSTVDSSNLMPFWKWNPFGCFLLSCLFFSIFILIT